jgi:hypothetical protein
MWSYASQWSWWRSSVCHHQEGDWAPWTWIPPSRDSQATAAGIAQSACLEGSESIHEPLCHTNVFFRTLIFVHSPDSHLDLLFTYLKTQLQERQDDSWRLNLTGCGRKQRILLFTVKNFRIRTKRDIPWSEERLFATKDVFLVYKVNYLLTS